MGERRSERTVCQKGVHKGSVLIMECTVCSSDKTAGEIQFCSTAGVGDVLMPSQGSRHPFEGAATSLPTL